MPTRLGLVLGCTTTLLLGGAGATASAGITGLQPTGTTSTGSSSNKTVTTTCPAGKRVLGPAATISGPGPVFTFDQVIFDDMRPSADLTGVTVQALEDETGTPDNWFVHAAAMCSRPPPGLERVSATSALTSSNKSVTATCPAGKQVLGTGADINAGNGQVVLDDLRPNAALSAVTAQAVEDETGHSGPWSVTAYAVCANAIVGLERISTDSGLGSDDPRIGQFLCSGKRVTGTGADINAGNGQAFVTHFGIAPLGNTSGVLQAAVEDETGHPSLWSLTSYAICARTVELGQIASTAQNSSSPKEVPVSCLLSEHQAIGLGRLDVMSGGQEVVPDRFGPDGSTAHEDEGGFAGSWRLDARAICADPYPGQEIVSATSVQNSISAKGISATCPVGKRVIGAAGEVTNGLGQVFLVAVRPSSDLSAASAFALEDENGTDQAWSLTARAVCAEPPPGLERISATSASDSATTKSASAACPPGTGLLSTGFDLESSLGQVFLRGLSTDELLLSQATVTGTEDATGNAIDWTVTAYGVCAQP